MINITEAGRECMEPGNFMPWDKMEWSTGYSATYGTEYRDMVYPFNLNILFFNKEYRSIMEAKDHCYRHGFGELAPISTATEYDTFSTHSMLRIKIKDHGFLPPATVKYGYQSMTRILIIFGWMIGMIVMH